VGDVTGSTSRGHDGVEAEGAGSARGRSMMRGDLGLGDGDAVPADDASECTEKDEEGVGESPSKLRTSGSVHVDECSCRLASGSACGATKGT
jgi:hypothetical protein